MTHIRLEYSEQQQCFHYNYGDQPPESNGYRTLVESIEIEKAEEIIRSFNKQFTNRDKMNFAKLKSLFINI